MFSFKRSRRGTRRHAATGDSTYPAVERRQDIRRPAFCFVEIRGEDGTALIDASIRELSAFGARLRLQSALRLPERLIIRPVSDMTANTATLRWVSGVSVGVSFDNEVKMPKRDCDTVRRLCIIETDLFRVRASDDAAD